MKFEHLKRFLYDQVGTAKGNIILGAVEKYINSQHSGNALVGGSLPKSAEEVAAARNTIYHNRNLTYGYKDDVIAVLDWVLTGEPFDGLDGQ